jgi:hypothetical protein
MNGLRLNKNEIKYLRRMKMDEELNKIVDTYYEDAPIIDTNEDSLETYNEVEIRRSTYDE